MKHPVLIDSKTRDLIDVGTVRKTFRGESVTVTGWREGSHAGSTGRVYVTNEHGGDEQFFPSVIDAEIVDGSISAIFASWAASAPKPSRKRSR